MTTHQIESMIMAMEDAQQGNKNIYLMQVDFTEAFDTINHTKLVKIMRDLGYPEDAIRVVNNMYTGATTSVQTPYGPTCTIPVCRGTLQGDSLSPYLFIVYMEPLLRWLRVGGRGYKYASIQDFAQSVQHQVADCTFADDLNILTGTIQDMAVQANKLTTFADWGDLTVNMKKSSATAALYQQQPQDPYDARTIARQVGYHLEVQGQPVQMHPPKEPFRYLGIYMTMDLNWKHQFETVLCKLKDKVGHLNASWMSRAQKLRVIRTCLRPMIVYTFAAACFSPTQLAKLDSPLLQATKKAYGLGACTSSAFAHTDASDGGLGCHSLMVEYATYLAQRIVRSMNDTTTHGFLSRALLQAQLAKMGDPTATPLQKASIVNNSLRLRQLLALQQLGLQLDRNGTTMPIVEDPGDAKTKQTRMLVTESVHQAVTDDTRHTLEADATKLA
jgi:hypothetical protein